MFQAVEGFVGFDFEDPGAVFDRKEGGVGRFFQLKADFVAECHFREGNGFPAFANGAGGKNFSGENELVDFRELRA